jgi:sirohydrochlorin cobaltochelatase
VGDGVGDITVVPVFLGQGGHLLRDLPQLADQIRAAHPGLRLRVAGAVGEDPAVQMAMSDYCIRSLG